MESFIPKYLAEYFKLPLRFFLPEANLYTLSVLSLYFSETEPNRRGIDPTDIDTEKLSLSVQDLDHKITNNNFKIFLNKVLKQPGDEPVYFQDYIGRDGFCEHQLHMVLCIMEMPDKNEKFLQDSDLLDKANTVGEMTKAFDILKYFSKN